MDGRRSADTMNGAFLDGECFPDVFSLPIIPIYSTNHALLLYFFDDKCEWVLKEVKVKQNFRKGGDSSQTLSFTWCPFSACLGRSVGRSGIPSCPS